MLSQRAPTVSPFTARFTAILILTHDYLLLPQANALTGVIWSRYSSEFVQIFNIESFARINNENLMITRAMEIHDFNGAQLKFSAFPIPQLINLVPNSTLVSGIHGDMWQLLSTMLNFKMKFIEVKEHEFGVRSANGSWNGLLGYIYRNETDVIPRAVLFPSRLTAIDFTLATWRTGYRFYMKTHLQYQRTWMTELFTYQLWLSWTVFLFLLSFASFFLRALSLEKVDKVNDSTSRLREHFFYVFTIFCNQGSPSPQIERRSRILSLSMRLFSGLLIIAFSSKLISHITQRKFHPPFTDLESFYNNTDYMLLTKRNSFVSSVFKLAPRPIYKMFVDSGRIIQSGDTEAYEKICNGKYVFFEAQDVVEARDENLCKINFVGRPYYSTWITGGLVRGFKYRKTIDLGILKLHEFGLIDRLKSTWLTKSTATPDSNNFESIRMEHVSLVFAMLACAVLLSLLMFLFENLAHTLHQT